MTSSSPPPRDTALLVVSRSEAETVALGRAIGEALEAGDVVLLSGELGAGKTTMAHGIASGAGVAGHARSPTFVLVAEHHGRIRLSHADLYRVGSPEEVAELALEERLTDGALVVEWPERGHGALPEDAVLVQIEVDPQTDQRAITLTPSGPRSARLVARASAAYSLIAAGGPQ